MEMRYMTYKNEEGQKERFYPITHKDAIVGLSDIPEVSGNDLISTEAASEIVGDAPEIDPAIIDLVNSLTASDVGALPIQMITCTYGNTDEEIIRGLSENWSKLPVGIGSIHFSNGADVWYGTYYKYTDTIGSILMQNASGAYSKKFIRGNNTLIDLYTEDNKPTASDVGAAEVSQLFKLEMPVTALNSEDEINSYYNNYSNDFPQHTWYRFLVSHNIAHSILAGGMYLIEGYKSDNNYEWQTATTYGGDCIQFRRSKLGGVWSNWTTRFLPLTGGTLDGDLWLDKTSAIGKSRLAKNSSATADYGTELRDYDANGNLVYFRLSALNNQLTFIDKNSVVHQVFGQHNKPFGSYTGNGSATSRTINTGGIGNLLHLWCPHHSRHSIVGIAGAITWMYDGTVKSVGSEVCKFTSGVLTIASTDYAFNNNGVEYRYEVL